MEAGAAEGLTALDAAVIAIYLVGVVALGLWAGGRQRSATDYFLGGRDLPWWAVTGSIVATETSTLTVIGVPAVAYGGSLVFLQLAVGFLLGRVVVAAVLLPRYFRGGFTTAYAFLGARFGTGMQRLAAATFLLTRLLADGVRLFATAIPIRVIALSAGVELGYPEIILGLAVATALYTLVGGLRAVVWMDVLQLAVYVGGAVLAVGTLLVEAPAGWGAEAAAVGKTRVVDLGLGMPVGEWLRSPNVLPVALVGGACFAMASHGTDQLIVQRLLACRSLRDGRRALVGSGVGVVLQFGLFLVLGLLLWVHYGGADPAALGLDRADEVFPKFIVEEMPPGVAGLLLAGIVAAAMSTLSSSLSALASSTVFDLLRPDGGRAGGEAEEERALRTGRWAVLGWAAVLGGFALLFRSVENPVVELGLGIASFTYGGLLGAFALGLSGWAVRPRGAVIAFAITILGLTIAVTSGWLAWPLYPALGVAVTLAVGVVVRRSGRAAA